MTRLSQRIAKLETTLANNGVRFVVSNHPPGDEDWTAIGIAEDDKQSGRCLTEEEWQAKFRR
ncbi:hypothetical protein BIWAKO_03403 [Bosea sp. BIWAKO-01]|nr:hypothetical protein BIWAKO_03403 [Bosea sp. BIWAKO-01]